VNLVDEIDPSFLVVNASKMNMQKNHQNKNQQNDMPNSIRLV
jgi:hypothetical protein